MINIINNRDLLVFMLIILGKINEGHPSLMFLCRAQTSSYVGPQAPREKHGLALITLLYIPKGVYVIDTSSIATSPLISNAATDRKNNYNARKPFRLYVNKILILYY
jgi:hypothetical protein